MSKRSGFRDSIVTGDEKWIVFDNTTRKNQWLDLDEVPIGVAKQHRFVKKAMLCVWWNTRGVVHYEVLDACNNVDSTL